MLLGPTRRGRAKFGHSLRVAQGRLRPPCIAEPLEPRLLMAAARAQGGSGYSGTLSTNPTTRQQQLICDPVEPLQGSTSVFYNPQQVSLAAAAPGPGYNNRFFGGFVEVSNFDGGSSLVPLNQFLQNRPQPGSTGETGFVQIVYQLTGTAGQIAPPTANTVVDEGGVDGIDTHALTFDLLPGVPTNATIPYSIRAANANTRSGNAEDFLIVNDGSGTRLGPAQIAQATVQSNPTNGSLSGTIFEDVDGDGVRDPEDAALPGVTAYLDTNNNGSREVTEPARVSDENGMYLFDDLTPGTYNVRRIAPAEFLAGPSTPAAGVYAVAVAAGRRTRGLDFGNVRPVSVRVTDVFVNATSWSGTYRKFVTDRALGESAYGVNVGGGAVALDELPWLGLNQVSIRFNTQANVGPYHLAIRSAAGPAATYAITNYAYDPATRTATWTLAAPLGLDRVRLDLDGDPGGVTDQTGRSLLDGESTNDALPSGNGTVGGDFRFRLNVVPGDVDRNGRVDAFDTLGVKAKQGSSPTVNPTNYSAILDVDGSGRIDAFDTLGVKAKQGTSLSQVPNPPLVVAAPLFGERRLAGDAEADELAALLA